VVDRQRSAHRSGDAQEIGTWEPSDRKTGRGRIAAANTRDGPGLSQSRAVAAARAAPHGPRRPASSCALGIAIWAPLDRNVTGARPARAWHPVKSPAWNRASEPCSGPGQGPVNIPRSPRPRRGNAPATGVIHLIRETGSPEWQPPQSPSAARNRRILRCQAGLVDRNGVFCSYLPGFLKNGTLSDLAP
jgi:hypothetical protein